MIIIYCSQKQSYRNHMIVLGETNDRNNSSSTHLDFLDTPTPLKANSSIITTSKKGGLTVHYVVWGF